MKGLRISEDLVLPLDAVTQTFGILAMRGAGKTNLARVMAEEMYAAKIPFVAVDPVGSWWGLRSSRDGNGAGIEIPIFGGRKQDVPLEKTGGALIADLVVGDRLSCVLDVSEFSEGDKIRFLIDFAERLYRKNQDPLHLFLEEADDYCPQRPFREQARLLRSWENIVRRGRARGLGITMITQRSASLNKSVLTQVETLFVLRTTSPQDRKAIAAWVEFHGQAKELLASLEGLKNGEAWVWSPSWLRTTARVLTRRSTTFDSGATPKDVHGARPPANLADVDLGAIKTRMAETIERAKAEDPRELRKKILELERELKARPAAETKIERVEVPVVTDSQLATVRGIVEAFQQRSAEVFRASEVLAQAGNELSSALKRPGNGHAGPSFPARHPIVPAPTRPRATRETKPSRGVDPDPAVGRGGLRRMLTALAQRPQGLSAQQLGVRAGLSSKSGTFDTYLGRGRAAGWMEGSRDRLTITAAGIAALGTYEDLPTGRELLSYWQGELGASGASRMLSALADAYPKPLTRAELADRAGLTGNSGTFDTYLGRLRRLELVEGRGELRASEELFS